MEKTLDIKSVADEIIRVEYPTYERAAIPQMRNAIIRKRREVERILKQHIKSACEFYLRYRDNWELLKSEHPELKEDVEKVTEKYLKRLEMLEKSYGPAIKVERGSVVVFTGLLEEKRNVLEALKAEYDEWLLKLAFSGVFEEDGGGDVSCLGREP